MNNYLLILKNCIPKMYSVCNFKFGLISKAFLLYFNEGRKLGLQVSWAEINHFPWRQLVSQRPESAGVVVVRK